MQRGAPSLQVRHKKEGHRSRPSTPAPVPVPGFAGRRVPQLHPPLADKETMPRAWAAGVHRASGWTPFPLSSRHHQEKRIPNLGGAAPRGLWLITSHRFWFPCFSSSEEEPITQVHATFYGVHHSRGVYGIFSSPQPSAAPQNICYIFLRFQNIMV